MTNKFNYFLEVFKICYRIEKLPEVVYGDSLSGKIFIRQSVANNFFTDNIEINPRTIIWKEWKGRSIPFLFDSTENEIISINNNCVIINFDIIASGFYLLSGYQELDKSKRDSLGRFSYHESIQHKLRIITIPVVNYYFDILKTAIEKVSGISIASRFSDNNDFSVCLTHDVDNCENGWLEGSAWAVKNGKYLAPLNLLYQKFIKRKDNWFNFDSLLDIEKQLDAKSSFYFLCKKGKYLGKANADYNIADKRFQEVFEKIKEAGSEIGIHGSFGTHNNKDLLETDIRKLNQNVSGGRFHFLEFEVESTPQVIEQAGLKYDTSLCFAEHIGFRNSCCTPFLLYDFSEDEPTSVLEIPLNLMDGTLSGKKYMNLTPDTSIEVVNCLIDEIRKFNGVFTILWHNTYYSDYKYGGWRIIIKKILQICKNENAVITSAENIMNMALNKFNET